MSDYGKLVEALRSRSVLCETHDCDDCEAVHFVCTDKILHDAAAAIEGLQAEVAKLKRVNMEIFEDLPKRGEWVCADDDFNIWTCSICGLDFQLNEGTPKENNMAYCPSCGAKMEVQDGPIITPCRGCSDYDGYGGCKSKGGCARAKMEVQE